MNAQQTVSYTYFTNSTDLDACRGFTSIHHAVWSREDPKKDNVNASYPVVADLDPQSPAGLSGLANGDSIVTVNRVSTVGSADPEIGLWNLERGDLNTFQVKRGNRLIELSFHMGEWVKAPSVSAVANAGAVQPQKVCRPLKQP
ncbi:MAG: PDZ domain-containing protein [Gemmatimonadaceae bacterium]